METLVGFAVILLWLVVFALFYKAMTVPKQQYPQWAIPCAFLCIAFGPFAVLLWVCLAGRLAWHHG